MRARSVFLTGATGFIGRNLVASLVPRQVHVLSRRGSNVGSLAEIDGLHFHNYDGTTESLIRALERAKPEIVYHLAAYFVAEHKTADIEPLILSNILLGAQLLEAMSMTGVHRLINTGTSWQNFQNQEHRSVCLYAATKQAFEELIDYYTDARGLIATTLQLFDTYGPGDPRPKLFNLLINADISKPLQFSEGEQLIDLVYIDDVVRAFLIAEERFIQQTSPSHERFAVSSGAPRPLREIVETFLAIAGSGLRIEWGKRPYRAREVMQPWTPYTSVPGWSPRVGLQEGLASLLSSREGSNSTVGR
jgi:nucleoside-diphosphate-sugar epimerase